MPTKKTAKKTNKRATKKTATKQPAPQPRDPTTSEKIKLKNAENIQRKLSEGKTTTVRERREMEEAHVLKLAIAEGRQVSSDATVKAIELAEWLGTTRKTVSILTTDGVLKGERISRSEIQYPLKESVQRYCQWVSTGKNKGKNIKDLTMRREIAETDRAEYEAELKRIQLRQDEGTLADRSLIKSTIASVLTPVKSHIMNLKALGADCNPSDRLQAERVLDQEKGRILKAIEKALNQTDATIDAPEKRGGKT